MTLRGINQQPVAASIVAAARVGRGRRFHGRIGGGPAIGSGLRGIVDIGLRDVGAAVAALSAEDDDLSGRIVVHKNVRVPRAGSAVGADLRPRVGGGSVLPGVGAGCAVYAGKAAIQQHAVDVRHVDHRAFLAVSGIRRTGSRLRPFAGAGSAAVSEGIKIISERALARARRNVHAIAAGVPGNLIVSMAVVGSCRAVAGAASGGSIAHPQLGPYSICGIETEHGVSVNAGASCGIVLGNQQSAVLDVVNSIGPIGVCRWSSGRRNRLPRLRPGET